MIFKMCSYERKIENNFVLHGKMSKLYSVDKRPTTKTPYFSALTISTCLETNCQHHLKSFGLNSICSWSFADILNKK